jgi:hypothetical protein
MSAIEIRMRRATRATRCGESAEPFLLRRMLPCIVAGSTL